MQLSEWERDHLSPKDGWMPERVRPIDYAGHRASNPWWVTADEQLLYPCFEGVSTSNRHGVRFLGRCGKWTCRNCGEWKKQRLLGEIGFARSVHRGLAVFSVLTFWHKNGVVRNPRTGRILSLDTQRAYIRKWYKAVEEIVGKARCSIVEFHRDGSIHMNVIWFGVKRGFYSCPLLNRANIRDMRLQCGICDACRMRQEWTRISGAVRSTHEITTGNTARYVGKYLTKDVMSQRYATQRIHRFSFSQAVKRLPSVVPVYRYIGQTIRDAGLWRWGVKNGKSDERWIDYITDEGVFFADESTWHPAGGVDSDGKWLERELCSVEHHGLCDRVPYWSPTKQRAWDYKHWDWFAKTYGNDTREMIQDKIYDAWEYIMPRLEETPSYD